MPNSAMDLLVDASEKFTSDPRLVLGIARIYDMLGNPEKGSNEYKKVLSLDASNIEALASLGAHFFYSDQPELSIRYYRRLLQMGIQNAELWNNLGLCCFYSSQYDLALSCMDRALCVASDDNMADVWYNIGHVGVALGDLSLAYQAFKVAASVDSNHGEALNNIAVLEMRRQKIDLAKACLHSSVDSSPQLFEPMFNTGL
jgi:tetratricopeptide repeat protein 8